jgi:hypothetical protein
MVSDNVTGECFTLFIKGHFSFSLQENNNYSLCLHKPGSNTIWAFAAFLLAARQSGDH